MSHQHQMHELVQWCFARGGRWCLRMSSSCTVVEGPHFSHAAFHVTPGTCMQYVGAVCGSLVPSLVPFNPSVCNQQQSKSPLQCPQRPKTAHKDTHGIMSTRASIVPNASPVERLAPVPWVSWHGGNCNGWILITARTKVLVSPPCWWHLALPQSSAHAHMGRDPLSA